MRTAALTCPEAEVLVVLGTELLQQGEEEYTEGVLDPKHRTVAPHGGKHDQPPPAALWVHKVNRITRRGRASLRDAHLAVEVALFLFPLGVTCGQLVVLVGVNSPFCHLCIKLGLLGGPELCGNWFSVTQSKPMQSKIAPGGGAPGNPALGWNRSLTRPAAPQRSPSRSGAKNKSLGSFGVTYSLEQSLPGPNMEKYVRTSTSDHDTPPDAAVIRTLQSGLSATYKNAYVEAKFNYV